MTNHAFVLSSLDYCNSLFTCLSNTSLDHLQAVQKAVAVGCVNHILSFFKFTRSQPIRNWNICALLHHHQNTKWGNINWKNPVHPSSRVSQTSRINDSWSSVPQKMQDPVFETTRLTVKFPQLFWLGSRGYPFFSNVENPFSEDYQ